MALTCVRCGREAPLVDGRLCAECYLDVYGLGRGPDSIELIVCPRCGSFRYGGRWVEAAGEGYREALALLFQARFRPAEHVAYYRVEEVRIREDEALVHVIGKLRGDTVERAVTYAVRFTVKHRVCPSCARKASGAPLAIVQVRGYGGRLDEEEEKLLEAAIPAALRGVEDHVIALEKVKEGYDVKTTDHAAARLLASRLKSLLAATVKESFKLITQRRNGTRVYRLTVSVRLPFFSEGSIVEYQGSLARIEEISSGRVVVRKLGSTRRRALTVEDSWRLLKKPSIEEDYNVIVTSISPNWIQIQTLEPSYNYLELRMEEIVKEGEVREGKYCKLLAYNGRYYLLC